MRRRWPGHGHARRAAELSFAGLALALASSVVWGTADFAGGLLTKRLPAFGVTLFSQAAGFVVLIAAVAVRGELGGRSLAHAILGERLTRKQKAGIGIALAGVVAIAGA